MRSAPLPLPPPLFPPTLPHHPPPPPSTPPSPSPPSSEKLAFADLPKGLAAWDAVPMAGKVQILLAAGLIELASELKKPVRHPCS